jgi:hypothetical protein
VTDPATDVAADAERVARRYPGTPADQPTHTYYVSADAFGPATLGEHAAEARRLFARHAADAEVLALVFALPPEVAARVHPRLERKLAIQPVEDLRVDFEDGYGPYGDHEEDAHARAAGRALGMLLGDATATLQAPRRAGLRVRSYADGGRRRALRTLDRFLDGLLESGDGLPGDFVITFPKVVAVGHVGALAADLTACERRRGIGAGAIGIELQVETTQTLLDPDGAVPLLRMVDAAGGRLRGAHLGVFDLTAALDLPAAEQRLDHPLCDHARAIVRFALAGTGVELADGSTNVRPTDDTTPAVHAAWARHAADVRHSLRHGWWQGWDLHPAHLVSRFGAVYGAHLDVLDAHLARVAAWANGRPAPGGVLDEPATVRVLLRQLRRAVACGAADHAEILGRAQIDAHTWHHGP